MLELYVNIKKRREELNMSQETLAKLVGYTSRSTIARIERGDIDLPQSMIMKFAKALNISPGELMGWDDESLAPQAHSSQMLEADLGPGHYLDPDVAELAQQLYERPEMRVLFDASRDATTEDVQMAADLLNRLSKK